MPTDPNSSQAYRQLTESGKLGELQRQVLWLYMTYRDLTPFEVVNLMREHFSRGRGTSDSIRTRISELTKMGLLEKTKQKRTCPHSGASNWVWRWKGRTEPVVSPPKGLNLKAALKELTDITKNYDTSANLERLLLKLHQRTRL